MRTLTVAISVTLILWEVEDARRNKSREEQWTLAQERAAKQQEVQRSLVEEGERSAAKERDMSYTLPKVTRAGIIGAPPRGVPAQYREDSPWDSKSGHVEPPPPGVHATRVLKHGEAVSIPTKPLRGGTTTWPSLKGTPNADFPGLKDLPTGQAPRPAVVVDPTDVWRGAGNVYKECQASGLETLHEDAVVDKSEECIDEERGRMSD